MAAETRPPRLVVAGDWWVLLVIFGGVAGIVAVLHAVAAGRPSVDFTDLAVGLAAGALLLLSLFAHEGGHAVAGLIVGRAPTSLRLGAIPSVRFGPEPLQGWRLVVVAVAGPVVDLLCGTVLITLTAVPVSLIGWVTVANGGCNLIPLRGSDGRQALDGLRDLRRHRGGGA